ncbi:hypothetical protein CCAX7_56990 [Capsulimonas corticalis]|uniref:beta-N-acetylhexosaminidase n=1 Tax=Capsulimonas corticalis TaxID=2219043 RepID=A0A402D0H7_9BACT|nr:hypothetical protein CCAX7_56990 [Capsulimonas corticalis]
MFNPARPSLIAALILAAIATPVCAQTAQLLPVPSETVWKSGRLALSSQFHISLRGARDARVSAAARRLLLTSAHETGLPISPVVLDAKSNAALIIQCDKIGPATQTAQDDESYTLDVTKRGAALSAPGPLGVMHGLETFRQLIARDGSRFYLPAVHIYDAPRFPWRGLMIDVSRHWMPVSAIERNLDQMAQFKLNVFH